MNKPLYSPGCFGSALAFDEVNSVCKSCVFKGECKPVHEENLAALRHHFNIPENKPAVRKPKPQPNSEFTVPVKTQALIDRIERNNINVTGSFTKNENPFEHFSPFLKITAHILLKVKRPVTRQDLVAAFMHKLDWTKSTADSHARMAIQALTLIGAVKLTDGNIQLKGR